VSISASYITWSPKVNQFWMKWMRSMVSMGNGGRPVLLLGLRGGRVLQYMGLVLALIGILMIMVFVGIFMIGVGIFMWRAGKKIVNACQYQISLLERQKAMVSCIHGVRLL
jgi:hypothetical protein